MELNENSLNLRVSTASLPRYVLPTIFSSIFMNIYSIVDQLFVSNLLGTDALSAVSIAGPFLAIALAVGTMIATGGCALVSNQMGDGKTEKARQNFSFFLLFSVAISTVFCILGIAPVVSYHYGAEHFSELKTLYRVACKTIAVMSVFTFAIAFPLARPIARLFADGSESVVSMAVRGSSLRQHFC